MLTADIAITNFKADGTNWLVDYNITGSNVAAFDISIYRSSDGTSLDAILQTERVTNSAKLQIGNGHQVTILPSFTDTDTDYFLIAVVDANSEISESNEANNHRLLGYGIFQNSDQIVHVHGTYATDQVVVADSTDISVRLNSTIYTYSLSSVPQVRIRTHAGKDLVIGTGAGVTSVSLYIMGGDGDDTVIGGAGNDFIYGGNGDDRLHGMDGNDQLFGEAGADLLVGYNGTDLLDGGAGNDSLDGGVGDDVYRFWGSSNLGLDTICEIANNGTDTLDFSGAIGSGIGLDLGLTGSSQTVHTNLQLVISNSNALENVIGSNGDDLIIGNDLDNILIGLDGDDWIEGWAGDDTIYGNDGDDTLIGEGTYYTGQANGNDTIYGGSGDDWLFGNTGYCDCASNDDDWLYGEDGDDYLVGDGGADFLNGGSGTDDFGSTQSGDFIADNPAITSFYSEIDPQSGVLYIRGHVEDDADPDGLTVYFGGVLQGYSVTVDENGDFEISMDAEMAPTGEVTASITDWEGLQSDEESILI